MNLYEMQESKKTKVVSRALREHYEINVDFDSLTLAKAKKMLSGIKSLIKEARADRSVYDSHKNSTYLKLVMMEQALTNRIAEGSKGVRIVVENEEVQKSQVILAAQDMIDSIQKMLETISKMNVEELNAVADGIKNEFGTAEGDQFASTVGGALTTLQGAITDAKNTLDGALGVVTGVESGGVDAAAPVEMPDLGGAEGEEIVDMGAEIEEPAEEPVEPEMAAVGRERR
jgi:hypothetical protein